MAIFVPVSSFFLFALSVFLCMSSGRTLALVNTFSNLFIVYNVHYTYQALLLLLVVFMYPMYTTDMLSHCYF